MKRRRILAALFLLPGCSDGDGFDPPRDDLPALRVEAVAVWEPGGAWADVDVFDAANVPVSGARVFLRGERRDEATEYPPGSGTYRIAPGRLDWDGHLGLEVDAGSRGYLWDRRHSTPTLHEIVSPLPFTQVGSGGFDVRWEGQGADVARVRLLRNDEHDDVGPDDGLHHVSGGYDESTNEEYVEVRRWREFVPEDALPGSTLRLEVRAMTGPISVTE